MNVNVLVVNNDDVTAIELDCLRGAMQSAWQSMGAAAVVDVTALRATALEFVAVESEIRRRRPDCVLMDGDLGRTSNDGLDFMVRLRCRTGYRGFLWLWTHHSREAIEEYFIQRAPWLFGSHGTGARSSAGDREAACKELALSIVEAWRSNNERFEVAETQAECVEIEEKSFQLLNLLQLTIWLSGDVRTSAIEEAREVWEGARGLRIGLRARTVTAATAGQIEGSMASLLEAEGDVEQRLRQLEFVRDRLLRAVEAAG